MNRLGREGLPVRFAVVVSMGLICLRATFTSGSAVAVTLVPGDIVAVDIVNASLIRIEASTGIAQTILSGGLLNNPRDIAVARSGLIYVTDSTGLLVIDPVSGSQSVLADRTGSDFDRFDVAANGDIILADTINRAIDRVDPTTGTRTPISSGGLIDASGSFSVTVTDAGRIFVLNFNNPSVIEIDPMTGSQTTVLPVGFLADANDIESTPNGDLLILGHSGTGRRR